ncbi:hypothetical protein GCM10027085_56500 [Spirosoma aerophilum]
MNEYTREISLYRTARTFNQGCNTQNDNRTDKSGKNLINHSAITAEDPAAYKSTGNAQKNFSEQRKRKAFENKISQPAGYCTYKN